MDGGNTKPMRIADFSGAVQAKTTENLRASNQLLHILNGDCDVKLGGIVGRKGSLTVSGGAIAAYRILNLFVYKYGSTKTYIAVLDNGSNIKTYKSANPDFAGSWSSVKDLTTGKETFWENFIGKAIFFNGQDTPQYTTDFSSYSNLTNAPAEGKFPFVLNQAIHVLTEGGMLHSSDVVDSTGLALTTTAWTSRGINPNDGQKCTFAIRHRGRGVLFKEESIYRYDGTNEPEAVITVGTHSWRSVVIGADGNLTFHHPTGIYEIVTGLPEVISRPVEKFLNGMSSSNWVNVAVTRDERNNYYWIGDVTISDPLEFDYGRTYTDVVLVWNVYLRRWTVYTGWNMRQGYFDPITRKTYFGTAAGTIKQIGVAYIDDSTPIPFEAMPHPNNYGASRYIKKFGYIGIFGRLQGQFLAGKSYEDILGAYSSAENMSDGVAEITSKVEARELWLMYAESYKETPPYIKEILIDDVEIYGQAK